MVGAEVGKAGRGRGRGGGGGGGYRQIRRFVFVDGWYVRW